MRYGKCVRAPVQDDSMAAGQGLAMQKEKVLPPAGDGAPALGVSRFR